MQHVTQPMNSTVLSKQFLPQLFETQVEQHPEKIAVRYEQTAYTYDQLNKQANQLAHYLRTRGVGPDVLVGLCIERSVEMLVALLAILKAGGAYIPLDPHYPCERLEFMLSDSQAPLLITQKQLHTVLPTYTGESIYIDDDMYTDQQPTNLALPIDEHQLAYTIYTSGSTGKPKGVQIPHRALANFLNSMREEPGISADDRLLAVTTLSFDIAGLELYLPLLVGATVIIAHRSVSTNGSTLATLIEQEHVTIMQATPITWRMLLAAHWTGSSSLKALCGGEALPLELANQLLPKVASLYNMYGPTETTIWSTVEKIETGQPFISIGHPIANTTLHILDEQHQPVSPGAIGELYIGGAGLARGYLKRPELTAERFLDCEIANQQTRLYRTGDLARYRNQKLEVLGRVDHQVKLRGFRIELGEIETLFDHDLAVQQTVAMVREDIPGDQRLVVYLLAVADKKISITALQHLARRQLPAYMHPSAFIILNTFPLTPNGKIDRQALPPPTYTEATAKEGPRTPVDAILLQIWTQVLHRPDIGIHDSFLDLGGHSLLATQVLIRVRQTFKMDIKLENFFAAQTIARLAEVLVEAEPKPGYVHTVARLYTHIKGLSTADIRTQLTSNEQRPMGTQQ